MKRSLARVHRALVCCALLAACHLACQVAAAQERDEAWVISQIAAGKLDELRSLETLSDRGVPFAMYWWGVILERCIFERCDKKAARELILRAAIAGHGRAQTQVFAAAETREEFDELVAKVGVPPGGRERFTYVAKALLLVNSTPLFGGKPRADDGKLRTHLLAIANSEPQIAMRTIAAVLQGPTTSADLEVLAETGIDAISEKLMQRAMIDKISDRQILERARAGKLGWAAASCDSLMIRTGRTALNRDELEVCEKAAAAGFPGAVRGLLIHHQFAGNTRAAQYFADLCEDVLGARCAGPISEYYSARSKESAELRAKWEFWDLVAANLSSATYAFAGGVSEEELRGKTPELRRRLFQLVVRTDLIGETCGMQRLDPATGAVEANPQCPWRRPIAIPAEFLGGAR
jgi:hypothetical protein